MATPRRAFAVTLVVGAFVGLSLSGCNESGPGEPVHATPAPAPPTLQEIWNGRLQAVVEQNISKLMLGYGDKSSFHLLQENESGVAWWDVAETRSTIEALYGGILTSSRPEVKASRVDEARRNVFFVWRSLLSPPRMGFELLHYDSKDMIAYQLSSVDCLGCAAALESTDRPAVESVSGQSVDLMREVVNRWKAGDVDGVMQLYTAESEILFYNQAEGERIQAFSGLAEIRQFYENDQNKTLGSRRGSWQSTTGFDPDLTDAFFRDQATGAIDLFITILPQKGATHIAGQYMMKASGSGATRRLRSL